MTARVVPLPGTNQDAFNHDIAESLLTAARVLARKARKHQRLGHTRIALGATDELCALVDLIDGGTETGGNAS